MVCAFVTNQLLHDQTSSSSDDDSDDGGLVTSLVDSLNAVDHYQQSTTQVTRCFLSLCLFLLCLCMSSLQIRMFRNFESLTVMKYGIISGTRS